jgi:hypothetical protein
MLAAFSHNPSDHENNSKVIAVLLTNRVVDGLRTLHTSVPGPHDLLELKGRSLVH